MKKFLFTRLSINSPLFCCLFFFCSYCNMVLDSGFILTLPPLHVVHPGMQGCPSCLFSSASPRTHHLPLQGSSSSMTQRMIAARRLMTSTWPEPLAPLLLCCLFVGTNCIALLHPTSRHFVHHVCGRAEGKVGGSGDKKKKTEAFLCLHLWT